MKKLAAAFVCLLASLSAWAQNSPDAEAALSRYVAATKSFDTAAMTALMHPDAMKRFRTTINTALTGPKAEQAKKELLPLFSVTTVEAYFALSDLEAYKRMNDRIAKSAPELREMMAKSTHEILGSFVKDGVAHVTYNLTMTFDGRPVNTQVSQMLKMHDGKWMLMLPSTADATMAGIEARFR